MLIDLRSDTSSLPTPEMRRAMAEAEVGDDTFAEDPTVRRLEERVADVLGTGSALFLLSGTMANLVALLTHCTPGDELFADHTAHVLRSEAGGYAALAGVTATPIVGNRGHLTADQVRQVHHGPDVHRPQARLVWLENTNNRAGGTVMPVAQQLGVTSTAAELGLLVHLDGARVFNAAIALGEPVDRLVRGVDSVYVDLTKGLACPMGSLLAGTAEFIDRARHRRRLVGGGMRQAGVVAACGLVALDQQVDRLIEDHALARWLAERIADLPGCVVDPDEVETNIVNVDVSAIGGASEIANAMRLAGVLVSQRPPDQIRLVTYLGIDRELAEEAARAIEGVVRDRQPTA
jgi:threonine aldolase